jgi:hypothetical protein
MTRHTRKNSMKRRKSSKKMYKQRGGTEFSPEQRVELMELGFTEQQIIELSELLDNMNAVDAINTIKISRVQINPISGQPNTPQEIIDSLQPENDIISDIGSDNNSEQHNISIDSINLDDSYNSDSGNTTEADDSDGSLHLSDLEGGKTRKGRTKKSRKTRKSRKGKSRKMRGRKQRGHKQRGHKQRGGARYGTGVGANNFDPNNSIYNTQELNLFPYKPN